MGVVDFTEEPDFTTAARFGDSDGVARFRCIDADENFSIIVHGSSSLR
jgi:hypothetical protein